MRKKLKIIIPIIIFLIGLGIFLYPIVTSFYNRYQLSQEVLQYEKELTEIKGRNQLDELYDEMKAYNKKIYEEGQVELSSEEAYEIPCMDLRDYGFRDNIVGSLYIDSIDLIVPIRLGASNDNMYKGVTHLSNTSLPIGGTNTNCVISGHRGMVSKEMFRHIDKIKVGDIVEIHNFWETLSYEVKYMEVVDVQETDRLFIQEGKDMLTLISCHPQEIFNQRYLVYCERVNE